MVSLWNSLEEDTRTISNYELFKETLMGNINDNPLFHLGTRQEQIIMVRLRMRSSDLKGHLHSIKIIESSACSCGFKNEDEIHFFLACPLYYRPRVTLLNALAHIAPLTVRIGRGFSAIAACTKKHDYTVCDQQKELLQFELE